MVYAFSADPKLMSYLLHRDHVLMPLHTSPPADRLGVALKSILTLNQYSSRFCFIFCKPSHASSPWIPTQPIHGLKIFQWGLREGWKRVHWGLPLLTLNEPSFNPLSTLSQQRIDRVWISRTWLRKSGATACCFSFIRKILLRFSHVKHVGWDK